MESIHGNVSQPDAQLLCDILDHTPVGLLVLELLDEQTKEFRVVHVNAHHVRMSGMDLQPFIGKTLREALPGVYEEGNELLDACLKVLKTGAATSFGGGNYGVAPASPQQLRVSCQPMNDRCVLVMAEHLPSLQAEEERTQLDQAQTQLSTLERALHSSRNELNEFIYAVSHDLTAPLRHIESYSTWILEDEGKKLSEDGRAQMEKIIRATQRLSSMVGGLVVYFRNYHLVPKKAPTDLTLMVAELREVLMQEAPSPDIQWNTASLPTVYADREMIYDVFHHLLSNAVKYTSDRKDRCIHIDVDEQESEFVFSIADNGVGFDSAYAGKLFSLFQRLHTRSEYGGIGLGLAHSRRIIELHGGRIWAEGWLGKGATFYFTLPR